MEEKKSFWNKIKETIKGLMPGKRAAATLLIGTALVAPSMAKTEAAPITNKNVKVINNMRFQNQAHLKSNQKIAQKMLNNVMQAKTVKNTNFKGPNIHAINKNHAPINKVNNFAKVTNQNHIHVETFHVRPDFSVIDSLNDNPMEDINSAQMLTKMAELLSKKDTMRKNRHIANHNFDISAVVNFNEALIQINNQISTIRIKELRDKLMTNISQKERTEINNKIRLVDIQNRYENINCKLNENEIKLKDSLRKGNIGPIGQSKANIRSLNMSKKNMVKDFSYTKYVGLKSRLSTINHKLMTERDESIKKQLLYERNEVTKDLSLIGLKEKYEVLTCDLNIAEMANQKQVVHNFNTQRNNVQYQLEHAMNSQLSR